MQNYQTRQKQLVADFFKEHRGKEFTVAEVVKRLKGEVGLSSVYRIIGRLEAEGKLKKEYKESPKAAAVYRYFDYEVCPKHLHLKCTECGDVSHLSVEATKEIVKIIGKDFVLNKEQTTLLGICSNCKKG
ncbi:MAG: transcriptional repressor [Clostridia bacterium]|nr:transcriptional repressor [Clostridia bacterium]